MASIKSLCDRIIYLKDGQIEYDGEPEIAINHYLSSNKSHSSSWVDGNQEYLYLNKISIQDKDREHRDLFEYDDDIFIQIELGNIDQISLTTAVRIIDSFGNIIFTSWDKDSISIDTNEYIASSNRSRLVQCMISGSILKPSSYTMVVFVRYLDKLGKTRAEEVNLSITISNENCVISPNRSGIIAPTCNWKMIGNQ